MTEDDTPPVESLLPYDAWTQRALRHVVISAVEHVIAEGLPGGHHFYITFKTVYPGVAIPPRLLAQYPDEMTIVLQHQFHNLQMDRGAETMTVGLSFAGIPSTLVIPIAAVTAFADPEVGFGLRFDVEMPETIARSEIPAPEGDDCPALPPDGPAEVVSLDAFRRRPRD